MQIIDTDFLIIGSGVSGLYAALELAGQGSVAVVTKAEMIDTGTSYAQGGIASVLDAADSFESHISDTLEAGAGLCDPEAVRILVTEGPDHIRNLMKMGARFERKEGGSLDLGREGGHSANRIVHSGDMTGKEVERVLVEAAHEKGVQILEYHVAVELITKYHIKDEEYPGIQPQCYGAYVYSRKSWEIFAIRARATILATGGAGQVYLHNTNPEVSTGDGIALAYRAGAVISNMEFYQFHPTALYDPERPSFLISEAMRGFGARLLDFNGQPFMQKYDERKELASRDIVARAIDSELKKSGRPHVWLDITHKQREELMGRFPNIFSTCLERGRDISREWIPVVPAAHYMCGGIRTDIWGRSSLDGLFAVGETACSGVHGGNRLASNSLLEGLVFSSRIGLHMKTAPGAPRRNPKEWEKEGLHNADEWILVQHNFNEIKEIMWNYVGIVRSDLRLNRALRRITLLHEEVMDFYRRTVIQNKILELRNLTLVAKLVVQCALMRKESRGLHYSTDYSENRAPSQTYTSVFRTE